MATKHDQLMKELIASFPAEFVRLAAPKIANRIDLEKINFKPEEYYPDSPSGRERRVDLVAQVLVRQVDNEAGETAEQVVLHAEIELRYRRTIESRLLSYHRGLSLKYARVVHTIVLYLRGGPPGPQVNNFEEISLGETVVTFQYFSLGLSRASAVDFLNREESLAWAFAALMRPTENQSRAQLGLACLHRITHAQQLNHVQRRLLFECVLRYARLQDVQAREFDKILGETEDEEVREMATSMLEWWRKQGLEEGRSEGQRVVLQLLKERFGNLSAEAQRRVLGIESTEELTRLAGRVYQVRSLEELGLA